MCIRDRLVIAHNAFFDRGFMEARLPIFKRKSWACSYAQIPWKSEGMGSSSLEFLAYRFGFHYAGHRASVDCHALLEVLQSELPVSGTKVMKVLLEKARLPEYKIYALNAPFDNKDKLKDHGYRWDAERRVWAGFVSQSELQNEVDWLREAISVSYTHLLIFSAFVFFSILIISLKSKTKTYVLIFYNSNLNQR